MSIKPGTPRAPIWSEREDALLRQHYPERGGKACQREIGTHRSLNAIRQRTNKLGMFSIKHYCYSTVARGIPRCIDCVHCMKAPALLDSICTINGRSCLAERYTSTRSHERCGERAKHFKASP